MSDSSVDRKSSLCREFLSCFSRVDPGATDWRGSTLFELAQSGATALQRRFDRGEVQVRTVWIRWKF